MLMLISPAKSLDEAPVELGVATTAPRLLGDTETLLKVMKRKSPRAIATLMGVSKPLSELNAGRYQAFEAQAEKPCVRLFDGDVYGGLKAEALDADALGFAQDHLRIASGLYGLLRPLDIIRPYRLEMGLPLKTTRGDTLYAFWGTRLARLLEADAAAIGTDTLLNLASHEYARAVLIKSLKLRAVNVKFLDIRDNQARIVSFFAKAARGMMARFVIDARLDRIEGVKDFNGGDYRFDPAGSTDTEWVFVRPQPPLKSAQSVLRSDES